MTRGVTTTERKIDVLEGNGYDHGEGVRCWRMVCILGLRGNGCAAGEFRLMRKLCLDECPRLGWAPSDDSEGLCGRGGVWLRRGRRRRRGVISFPFPWFLQLPEAWALPGEGGGARGQGGEGGIEGGVPSDLIQEVLHKKGGGAECK